MIGISRRILGVALAVLLLVGARAAGADELPHVHLKIVGGLGTTNQYARYEEPFWTKWVTERSNGSITAEIAAFDSSGIRGTEILQLLRLGAVPFGTTSLSLMSGDDPEAAGLDLVGLNPSIESLRRNVDAYRPVLAEMLRSRYGAELLAVYTYAPQVAYCKRPFSRLRDLAGLRVRTTGAVQVDFVESLGATGVTIAYAQIPDAFKTGIVDCAITGTQAGYRLGLPATASYLSELPLSFGPYVFVANEMNWRRLPQSVRDFLRAQIADLERQIWDGAVQEHIDGIACDTGQGPCAAGPPGKMKLVTPNPEDAQVLARSLRGTILPRWAERCGAECVQDWNRTVGAASGLTARIP